MGIFLTDSIDGLDRLFGLDLQLLADSCIELVAIFVLFVGMSYLLFTPARDFLKKRQEKIQGDLDSAAKDKEKASVLKAEYTDKLKGINEEAEAILSESRQKALKKESVIVGEAKEEAARIIDRAGKEAELEKSRIKDEVKQEMVSVAGLMAGKIVKASMDEAKQSSLIEETLKEMGDTTWQS